MELGLLEEKFRQAYHSIISELSQREDVTGILFFGSVQKGTESPSSDLDLYVVVDGNESWNYKKKMSQVPVEVYFFPASYWQKALEDSHHVMIAFATGSIILDRKHELKHLVELAKQRYTIGPPELSQLEINNLRIQLTELASDVEGVKPDTVEEMMLIGIAFSQALEAYCAFHKIWPSKPGKLQESMLKSDVTLRKIVTEMEEKTNHKEVIIRFIDYVLKDKGGRLEEYEGPRFKV